MKRICFLLCFLAAAALQAKKLVVSAPGTLGSLIGNRTHTITSLTIEGTLNSADLRVLRDMMGRDFQGRKTAGRLTRLNMSKVSFQPGGEPYMLKNVEQYITGSHTIPSFLFRECIIEELSLPERTDTLSTGALEYSQLRSIRIPEGATVMAWNFNALPNLRTIIFPKFVKSVERPNFSNCPQLKELNIGDAGYISSNLFVNMPALESITFGAIAHIDGWYTMSKCPRLKTVTFRGPVLHTGGPIMFADCPELENVTFDGPVYWNYIGNPENCPKLKRYVTNDWVFDSPIENAEMRLPQTPKAVIDADIAKFGKVYDQFRKMESWHKFAGHVAKGLYPATQFAKAGLMDKAGKELKEAVAEGVYRGYRKMAEDSSLYLLWKPAAKKNKDIADALALLKKESSYLWVLQQSSPYVRDNNARPDFTYQMRNDSNLQQIRAYFNLDSIAGDGDEISRIKNLMYWLHNEIPHNGSDGYPDNTPHDAISLHKACKAMKRGLNCRGLAQVLSQCYLAMGIPARFLSCQPRLFDQDNDCHVIDMVWSKSLNKWIWIDPSFAAYVTDENGLLLHPGEVRERLIKGLPLVLNEDANWNNKVKQTKEDYLEDYMAKNLYLFSSHLTNGYSNENGKSYQDDMYVTLAPTGFKDATTFPGYTNDDVYFWQAPK